MMQYFVLKMKLAQKSWEKMIADELGKNEATLSKWMEETKRLIIKKAFS